MNAFFSNILSLKNTVLFGGSALLVVVGLIFIAPNTNAAPNTTVEVDINQDLNFGKFVRPTSGNGRVRVREDSGTVTSNNIQLLTTSGQVAEALIKINKGNNTTFHVSFSNQANLSDVEFRRFRGSYQCTKECNFNGNFNLKTGESQSFSLDNNKKNEIKLIYGAVIRVRPTAPLGVVLPQYQLNIDFE